MTVRVVSRINAEGVFWAKILPDDTGRQVVQLHDISRHRFPNINFKLIITLSILPYCCCFCIQVVTCALYYFVKYFISYIIHLVKTPAGGSEGRG